MLRPLLLLALCSLSAVVLASPPPVSALHRLADETYWHSLGHYERGKLGGWRSYVDDDDFFLAEGGEQDPAAELAATLTALYAPATQGDRHAQCVYPARSRWLREQLNLTDLPAVECSEFATWYAEVAPHSAVLVFPAAYLNSPSSMFGHTLLRIDQANIDTQGSPLLSSALNFGAFIEGLDNSILYAWKGLMGGYPGLFSLLPYREKIGEYSRLENRDLWEYRLNLTPDETGRMLEHVWELKQIRFDYFFFDENCSYRLLELLEIARPGLRLTAQFPLTAIPADTVRAVIDAGLVEGIDYRPSRERELLARTEPLETEELNWVRQLADDPQLLEQSGYLELPAERRALIQDGAYRLVRYRVTGEERDAANAAQSYRLLQAINRNPPPRLEVERPILPEYGHESRTLQFGLGSHGDRAFAEYGLRMAYHDLLDNLEGFPMGAQIEIAQLRMRQYEGNRWTLQRLDLAGIRSLTPVTPLLRPWSWQVAAGLERVPEADQDRLVGHLNGGGGFTWQFGDGLLGFALATARLEHNPDFGAAISPAAGFDSGLLWRNRAGNLLLEARGDYFHNGEVRRRISFAQQFELYDDIGLRLGLERSFSHRAEAETEVQLQLRWYYY
ncbi:membrane protein [Stutzerimonas stutzeri]|uniref:Lnb N-terminal periplasmic domain-containing protein n=1 Tax=Stutzerimonas stutzeri subgroup TaxID=578833 RepID=UPI000C6D7E6F|nr:MULTISPECIES: DUF4105 domain-containing protein [Stutzerimonas stutzeri subgroup]MCQ2046457.1 DUF4105 domain-containing protein [Stutzerimonas kunmingensis]PKR26079.1 hypothetical protein CXK90_16405 [Stutzerimonas stutzeri]QQC13277.1 DUF4105 domain-containing protein [Stutzerimonas stutzeri]VEI37152.1 membrane protein [Stutzerimonas stutzeri]